MRREDATYSTRQIRLCSYRWLGAGTAVAPVLTHWSCVWQWMFSMYGLMCGCVCFIYGVCMLYLSYSRPIALPANVICCTCTRLEIKVILSYAYLFPPFSRSKSSCSILRINYTEAHIISVSYSTQLISFCETKAGIESISTYAVTFTACSHRAHAKAAGCPSRDTSCKHQRPVCH